MSEATSILKQNEMAAIFAMAAGCYIAQEGLCTAALCAAPFFVPWLIGGVAVVGAIGLYSILSDDDTPSETAPSSPSADISPLPIIVDEDELALPMSAKEALTMVLKTSDRPVSIHFHVHTNVVQQLYLQPQNVYNRPQ